MIRVPEDQEPAIEVDRRKGTQTQPPPDPVAITQDIPPQSVALALLMAIASRAEKMMPLVTDEATWQDQSEIMHELQMMETYIDTIRHMMAVRADRVSSPPSEDD